ncbi:TPA: SGNH/GDSL hydrolase family protein, partial [Klebsiella variicola subsp. variicola]
MPTINETSLWETDIPLIARLDKVEGGKAGLVNVQTSKLANRTAYLKGELEAYNALIKSGELPFTSEAEAQAAIVQGRIPEGALFSVRSEDPRVWAEEFTNAGGQAVATGKKILDGQSFTVTIFPTENDPDGTVTGISATFTGQTFRVVFHDDGGREVLYRNDNGTPTPLSETVGKAAV